MRALSTANTICCALATACISKAPRRIAGKIPGVPNRGFCGSTLRQRFEIAPRRKRLTVATDSGEFSLMFHTRRDFIKYVVAGSVAAGCPVDRALLAEPEGKSSDAKVEGEHFAICHQVRDQHSFARPEATRKTDVVILGGGMAGLSAAYFLPDKEWLLLEKEDHFGGNAYQEEYDGQAYSTAAAYDFRGSFSDQLAKEIGLDLRLIDMPDPTIDNGQYVPDTWGTGLEHLPYKKEAVASFKKFREDMMKIDLREGMAELDQKLFS